MSSLRVLMVEDDAADAELIRMELRRAKLDATFHRVVTEVELKVALESDRWDVILSDYSLPQFDAVGTLNLVHSLELDIPVIVISGSLGEERAVSLLRMGANDFILKDRMARLAPAIERECREAALRTERKKLREQLMVSDRMASLGLIASGVAHEINNPLAVLVGSLELLERMVGNSASTSQRPIAASAQEASRCVGAALEATDRIRQIVNDIRTFSRLDQAQPRPVSLVQVIASSLRLASTEVRHRAHIVQTFESTPHVLGHEGKLGQVLLNLVVNAAQAMPEGRLHENRIEIRTRQLDEHRVEIAIADNGRGIPADHLQRIFDPFFTTKPAGKGTGLGLAICRRVIDELGGEVRVSSVVGEGTTFYLTLPIAAPPSLAASIAPLTVKPTRRGRVLVIDDEPALLAIMRATLDKEHDVTTLGDPKQALSLLLGSDEFDVIFCDVAMPMLGGPELFEHVTRVRPELAQRFVFMTGYTSNDLQSVLEGVTNRVLPKPYDLANVKKLLHEMLGERTGRVTEARRD